MSSVLERKLGFVRPITMTTRAPRGDEVDGVHYFFATPEEFNAHLDAGDLLEHATIHGHEYGAPRKGLRDALASGCDVIMQVDVQGSEALRALLPDALYVFIAPESLAHLERRLEGRETEDAAGRARRLETARRELEAQARFEHVIVNHEGDLAGTVEALLALIERERARPGRAPLEV
jgi:guanylate kinase